MGEIINYPEKEKFKKRSNLNLRELLSIGDNDFDLEEGKYLLEELREAYFARALDSLSRSLGDLKELDVEVFIDKDGRLVFQDSNEIVEDAAKKLFLHHLQTKMAI